MGNTFSEPSPSNVSTSSRISSLPNHQAESNYSFPSSSSSSSSSSTSASSIIHDAIQSSDTTDDKTNVSEPISIAALYDELRKRISLSATIQTNPPTNPCNNSSFLASEARIESVRPNNGSWNSSTPANLPSNSSRSVFQDRRYKKEQTSYPEDPKRNTFPTEGTNNAYHTTPRTIRVNFPQLDSSYQVYTVPLLLPLYSTLEEFGTDTRNSITNIIDHSSSAASSTPSSSSLSSPFSRTSSPLSYSVSRTTDSSPSFYPKSETINQQNLDYYTEKLSSFTPWLYLSGEYPPQNRDTLIKHKIGMIINCAGEVVENVFEPQGIPCTLDDFFTYYSPPSPSADNDNSSHSPSISSLSIDPSSLSSIPIEQYSRYYIYLPVSYLTLSLRDGPFEDIVAFFYRVFYAIEYTRKCGLRTLIHCHQGVSRSPSFVMGYLMWLWNVSFTKIYNYVRNIRSIISPNLGFLCQLKEWEQYLHQCRSLVKEYYDSSVSVGIDKSNGMNRSFFQQPLVYRLQRMINGSYVTGPLFMNFDSTKKGSADVDTPRLWHNGRKQHILYTFRSFRSETNRSLLSLSSDLFLAHPKDIFFTVVGLFSENSSVENSVNNGRIHGLLWFGKDTNFTTNGDHGQAWILQEMAQELSVWEYVENVYLTGQNEKEYPLSIINERLVNDGIENTTDNRTPNSTLAFPSSVSSTICTPLRWNIQYIDPSSIDGSDDNEGILYRFMDSFRSFYSSQTMEEIRYAIHHPQSTVLYDLSVPTENIVNSLDSLAVNTKPSSNVGVPFSDTESSSSSTEEGSYISTARAKYCTKNSLSSNDRSFTYGGSTALPVENHRFDDSFHDLSGHSSGSNTSTPSSDSPLIPWEVNTTTNSTNIKDDHRRPPSFIKQLPSLEYVNRKPTDR